MSESEFSALLERISWPLFVGGLAAFCYLSLLAAAHTRAQILTQLCRNIIDRRENLQKRKDKDAHLKVTARLLRTEHQLRELMQKEGLTAPPPPNAPAKKT